MNFKKKKVCVIGGTGLIGSAIVDALVAHGAAVFIGSRRAPRRAGRSFPIDACDQSSVKEFIARAARGKPIDAWVNAMWPGNRDPVTGGFYEADPAAVLREAGEHLAAFYLCSAAALTYMRYRGGAIVNLGSIYGDLAPDFRVYKYTEVAYRPSYSMSEGAIHSLTRHLACAAAPFVRVNAVCPGGVLNGHGMEFQRRYAGRVPLCRMARPEEIAAAVVFLASDSASYITGQCLMVDGGLSAW